MANELAVLEQMRQGAPAEAPAPAAAAPAAPATAPSTPAEIPDVFENLPDEVKALPIIKLLSIGEPPAVMLEPGQYFPALEPIGRNLTGILKGGLDFYKSSSGQGIIFNPLFIDEAELKKADESGKLEQIIPSYGELMGEEPEAIPDDKFTSLLKQQEDNEVSLRQLSSQPEVPVETVPPPPAGVEAELTQARATNVKPTTPTSRPIPGGGAVLNGLIKRAV